MDTLQKQNNEEFNMQQPMKGMIITSVAMVQIPHVEYNNMVTKIQIYETESNRLKSTIEQKESIIAQMKESNDKQQKKIDQLTKDNENLRNKVYKLENQIKELRQQIKNQNEFNAKKIKEQDTRIKNLEHSLEQFKNRDEPITVREAFVVLEKFIMLEITGSKSKAKEYYGLKDLFRDKDRKLECDVFLIKYNITRDHT